MSIEFLHTIPILRIFSVEKAKEFYVGYLGFTVDWEHTFEPNMPVFMQVSRGNLRFFLSEHHGDGTPGTHVHVEMKGVDDFHAEVSEKNYKYLRPGVEDAFYGARAMTVIDPFGNEITFNEFKR
jgi:catechol 2,3-dioxygenase-like lactoylglutathione lyase family enzyme